MPSKRWMLMCAAAALGVVVYVGRPEPAQAQFGINIGGIPIGINIHGYGGRHYGGRRGARGAKRRGEDAEARTDNGRPAKEDKVVVSKGAPSMAEQTDVLKQRVFSMAMTGAVGSTKDISEVGKTTSSDRDRDYTRKIESIIVRFTNEHKDDTAGDVTAHAIEQSLEKAFKNAKLEVFERFIGESWTSERLRTMILERVEGDLAPLFQGTNRGNAPMHALDTLIQRAAEAVYRRIFETSELLAANKSSALFMQRLYQTHGPLVDEQLRENADIMIMRASMGAVRPFEPLMRRSENGFAERYRAQRIIFDCLSENVEKISSSETGIATAGEIESRIASTSTSACAPWLESQFGPERGELKVQKPLPMRVIWSAAGPKDDPSMYGRLSTF
jgi:hypothetical protein